MNGVSIFDASQGDLAPVGLDNRGNVLCLASADPFPLSLVFDAGGAVTELAAGASSVPAAMNSAGDCLITAGGQAQLYNIFTKQYRNVAAGAERVYGLNN